MPKSQVQYKFLTLQMKANVNTNKHSFSFVAKLFILFDTEKELL